MSRMNRRTFLGASSAAAGASLWFAGTKASGNILGANDRIRIAVAGLNGRGGAHIDGWLKQDNLEIAYLVDPDKNVLDKALAKVEKKTEGKYKTQGVSDVRKVLDDPLVHAVSIATPNHWHSLMAIWAMQAGKHVYVEKPMSHDVAEGRVAAMAQKKYGVVLQHGTQNRSSADIAGLHEAIKAGKFGKLKIAYGYCCKPRDTIGRKPVKQSPDNLDWNLWRGPANIEEYHDNLVHYNWHWFWPTGNGDLNNQGTHQLDIARWALDDDQTTPIRTMALGGRFKWDDQGETPNTMFSIAEYPNGQLVYFNVRNVNYDGYKNQVMNEYYFEDGGKITGGKYFAKGSTEGEKVSVPDGKVTPGGNWTSFISACRAGDPNMSNAKAMDSHYSCTLGHLMNNSYRLGRKEPFTAKAGDFGNNPDARGHFEKLHEIMSSGVGVKESEAEYTVGPWLTFDPKTERHTGDFAAEANALLKNPNRTGFEVPNAETELGAQAAVS
jgi:predicted dehydrogenase